MGWGVCVCWEKWQWRKRNRKKKQKHIIYSDNICNYLRCLKSYYDKYLYNGQGMHLIIYGSRKRLHQSINSYSSTWLSLSLSNIFSLYLTGKGRMRSLISLWLVEASKLWMEVICVTQAWSIWYVSVGDSKGLLSTVMMTWRLLCQPGFHPRDYSESPSPSTSKGHVAWVIKHSDFRFLKNCSIIYFIMIATWHKRQNL